MADRIFLDPLHPEVYIDCYVPEGACNLPAMLVIPGGGYSMVCESREGGPIARAYLKHGFCAFVLNYRVGAAAKYPAPQLDASRAILHIRENAAKYGIDPTRVYAVGFSAGGHLAGSLAILYKDKAIVDALGIEVGANRPDGCVLSYPVVSALMNTHLGSFVNLLGKEFELLSEEEKHRVSLEANADADSAPLFIWHTAEDKSVPPCGSLALCRRYIELGLPVSLHLYPYGPHGIGLATEETCADNPAFIQPLAAEWVDSSVAWIKSLW